MLLEANLTPFADRCKELSATGYVKSLCLPTPSPRKQIATAAADPSRTKRKDWRSLAVTAVEECGVGNLKLEEFITAPTIPPWTALGNTVFEADTINGITKQHSLEEQKVDTLKTIKSINADIEIYSDGSAGDNVNGGGGTLIKVKSSDTEFEVKCPAGKITSSLRAEMFAARAALQKVEELQREEVITADTLALFTDSKSTVQHLGKCRKHNDLLLDDIQKSLVNITSNGVPTTTIQWIPAHCGTEGNDRADVLAKEATELEQEDVPVNFATVKSVIKRKCKESWLLRSKPKIHFAKELKVGDESGLTKIERTLMSRLRTGGHTPHLRWYQHFITRTKKEVKSPICHRCNAAVEDTIHLFTNCPNLTELRTRTFNTDEDPVRLMWTEPKRIVKFLHEAGVFDTGAI